MRRWFSGSGRNQVDTQQRPQQAMKSQSHDIREHGGCFLGAVGTMSVANTPHAMQQWRTLLIFASGSRLKLTHCRAVDAADSGLIHTQGGFVASDFRQWWIVGTGLANALGVPRTTLISAVEAGHLRWRLLGSHERVVLFTEAKKWAEGRR